MPIPGMLDPAAQSILENMVPLREARSNALCNIAKAQDKQCRTYAARTRHAADPNVTSAITPATPPGLTTASAADKGKNVVASVVLPPVHIVAPPADHIPEPSMALATPSSSAAVTPIVTSVPASNTSVQVGDFVLVRKHEKVRTSGNKKGKLADKVDGPFILHAFTDAARLVAVLVDAEGTLFKKRTADLGVYRGTS
ncbi:hypothetical protein ABBQ38_007789 [Trebouxia sp. C0009 RCD-2024]